MENGQGGASMNYKWILRNGLTFLVMSSLFGLAMAVLLTEFYSQVNVIGLSLLVGFGLGVLYYLLASFTQGVVRGLIGLALGAVFAASIYIMPKGNWEQMQPAPAPVVELIKNLPVNFFEEVLFVKAQDGQVYSYNCPLNNIYFCTWKKVDPLPKPVTYLSCGRLYDQTNYIQDPTPLFPGNMVQWTAAWTCGAEAGRTDYFILLDDGSLWHWTYFHSVLDELCLLPFVILMGLVTGAAAKFLPFSSPGQGESPKNDLLGATEP